MFHCYFERKNDKVLTFKIAHVANFEINAPLLAASPLISAEHQFRYVISGALIRRNTLQGKRIFSKTKFSF